LIRAGGDNTQKPAYTRSLLIIGLLNKRLPATKCRELLAGEAFDGLDVKPGNFPDHIRRQPFGQGVSGNFLTAFLAALRLPCWLLAVCCASAQKSYKYS
jgi:hypothetical protein